VRERSRLRLYFDARRSLRTPVAEFRPNFTRNSPWRVRDILV